MVQRPRSTTVRLAGLVGLALYASPLLAHDSDPKLLDRQAPYAGKGIRTGVPAAGQSIRAKSGMSFPSNGVTLLSWLSLGDFGTGASAGNDCWGYVSGSGREYALMGLTTGTAFVEITDPSSPVILTHISGPDSTWRDMKVFGTRVYVVSEGGSGIQVFNLANIDSGQVTNQGTVTTGGTTATHNVAIDTDSGYLYRTGGSNEGLRIYDLNVNPTNPPLVGSWSDKYVHDAQVVTYTSGPLAGKEIAYCCSGFNGGFDNTGLSIVDVTNKSNPVVLDEVFWSQAAYSHQVWLSEDRQFAYLNDELDENGGSITTRTYVMNVADPSSAFLVGSFTNGNEAVGHNLYVKDDLLYESNYRSGLRVFDTSVSSSNPPEVYWFDTYLADDDNAFNGLWSNYPFFPSGVVIGSDIELGLFVWWVGPTPIDIEPQGVVPTLIDPNGQAIFFDITESAPGNLVGGSPTLNYDNGAGLQSVPLVALGGSSFRADVPALPCATTVDFFVSAESTNGITWTWPEGGAGSSASATVAFGETVLVDNDMETNQGWTSGIGSDDATTGIWTRVNPVGTGSQPEDDHTPSGSLCWVTGQGVVGGGLGDNDVDGGTTTLLSPVLDTTSLTDPVISYWRWYANNGNSAVDDTFQIQISNGGGWVNVEVLGPTGADSVGGWIQHQFKVGDFVAPNASVQMRFRASDLGSGSIVEAAIDDFQLKEFDCSTGSTPTAYCTGKVNSALCVPDIGWSGTPSASSGLPFSVTCDLVVAKNNGIFFYGKLPAANPFQGGTICAAAPITRTSAQFSGGNSGCEGTFSFDFNALIAAGSDASLVPGVQVNGQYWFRDPPATFGSGLSNAIEFVIQP